MVRFNFDDWKPEEIFAIISDLPRAVNVFFFYDTMDISWNISKSFCLNHSKEFDLEIPYFVIYPAIPKSNTLSIRLVDIWRQQCLLRRKNSCLFCALTFWFRSFCISMRCYSIMHIKTNPNRRISRVEEGPLLKLNWV